MKSIVPAFVAVVLLCAASANACEQVVIGQLQSGYVARQQFVAPVVYSPVVQAVQVAYAAPVVQQVVVKQQRVRRHPVRRAAQIVLPPYGCR